MTLEIIILDVIATISTSNLSLATKYYVIKIWRQNFIIKVINISKN